jgi:hypothetical protein
MREGLVFIYCTYRVIQEEIFTGRFIDLNVTKPCMGQFCKKEDIITQNFSHAILTLKRYDFI